MEVPIMNILFLGGTFSGELEKEILKKSKGSVQYAANKLQWNFIEGLSHIKEVNLEIISAPFIGSFPKEYTDFYFAKPSKIDFNNLPINYVGFINLWGIRNLFRRGSIKRELKKFIKKESKRKVIIVYSPHTPFLQAAIDAKIKNPSIHICLIVPDLPQFMNLSSKKTTIYQKLKYIDIKIFNKNSKYVDSFVILTKAMKEILEIGDRPFEVIEGMVNLNEFTNSNGRVHKEDVVNVVYTGTLNEKFGVINLVKAFHDIESPNIRLSICGKGDSEDIIKSYAERDNRIHFMGQLTNEEALKLQANATVLVNPRQADEEYTKYSFPSKNMEYLLSGVPVIAYNLEGIPKEYSEYLIYVEDNSIEALKLKIIEVIDLTEIKRSEIGRKAQKFVIEQKNNVEMSERVYEMILTNMK